MSLTAATTTSSQAAYSMASQIDTRQKEDTIGTRIWLEEYTFLQSLYHGPDNCSPKFRLPDLISACVSLVFLEPSPAEIIFTYLHAEFVLRNPDTERRQEDMWKPQYNLLLALQRSPANGHPNPQFKLDQFTTACIALVIARGDAKRLIFEQARKNTAERVSRKDSSTHGDQ